MFYGSELHFMCDVFKKSRISVCFASPKDSLNKVLDKNLLSILENSKIFDGGLGTAKEALRRIEAAGLKNENNTEGSISFISSKDEGSTKLYKKFFYM